MSKEVTAYKCDFCGRIFKSKSAITRHEKFCSKNPQNNFVCLWCKHMKKETHYTNDELKSKETTFTCNKLGLKLHTHKAVQRNMVDVLRTTELMKLKCSDYELIL